MHGRLRKGPSGGLHPGATPGALPRPLLRHNANFLPRAQAHDVRPPKGGQAWSYARLFNHAAPKTRPRGLRPPSPPSARPCGGPQHRSAGAAEVEKEVNRTNFGSTHPIAVEIQGGVLSGGHGTADGAQTTTDERERGRAAPSSPYRRFLCGGPPTRARSDKRRRWSSRWCATAC